MRFENLLAASYWIEPPTSPLGWVSGLGTLLISIALITFSVRAKPLLGRMQALWLLAALLAIAPLAGRLLNVPALSLRAWWLLSAACLLPTLASWCWFGVRRLLPGIGRALGVAGRVAGSPSARRLANATLVAIGAGLLMVMLVWNVWLAREIRTRGVTGSDPYAYAQMGVDLVEKGSIFHGFPLVYYTYLLNVETAPVVHLGYLLPQDARRISTTVWPPGYALFTAAAYALGGEAGLYWVTPVLATLSLPVIAWLVWLLCHRALGPGLAMLTAGATVALSATSYQQVEWQLIPMADIAAQLLSLLALALAMRGQSASTHRWAAMAGLALGAAFAVRYTQVFIAPALAFALWRLDDRRTSFRRVLACAGAAALAVLPVLAYHWQAFGSPFKVGSEELQHFQLWHILPVSQRFFADLSLPVEFGFLWPWLALGAALLLVKAPRMFVTVLLYAVPVLLFHMLYWYFRPRDLLSIFPIGYFLVAFGATALCTLVPWRIPRAAVLAAVAFFAWGVFWQRSTKVAELPVTRAFATFGYLHQPQRDSLAQIAAATPPNAAIGTALNGGAIDLHARRLAFRPGYWSASQAVVFVAALLRDGVPVFVLDDGVEMNDVLPELRRVFAFREVLRVDLPYYEFRGGGSVNKKVPLYEIRGAP